MAIRKPACEVRPTRRRAAMMRSSMRTSTAPFLSVTRLPKRAAMASETCCHGHFCSPRAHISRLSSGVRRSSSAVRRGGLPRRLREPPSSPWRPSSSASPPRLACGDRLRFQDGLRSGCHGHRTADHTDRSGPHDGVVGPALAVDGRIVARLVQANDRPWFPVAAFPWIRFPSCRSCRSAALACTALAPDSEWRGWCRHRRTSRP
jgi:hypothetical protein